MDPRVRTVLGVIAGFVAANNLSIPPPAWFWVAGMLVLLPLAWLGARAGAGARG